MGKPFIKGGTPVGSESLCKTCSYAHIMTGYRESEKITMCHRMDPNIVVPFLIYECSGFYDKNRPSWKQMEDLAIDVTPAPMKPVGFRVGVGFREAVAARTRANEFENEDEDND